MKTTSKRAAAFLAALIVTCTAIGHDPVCTQKVDAKAPAIRDFADSILPLLPDHSDTVFDSLCYSNKQKTLLRDGKAVGKDSFSGFCVIDGELKIAASETVRSGETAAPGYLSLEEAAPLIGLETYETDEGICVSDPFRSGTLIVKSDALTDTKGAEELGSGWNDLHVLQYATAADAYAAYLEYQSDDTVTYAEPNRIYHIDAAENDDADPASGYEFPADNWGWDAVGADGFLTQYRESAQSAPDVVVAVIDTGIYSGHNWFQNRIAEGGASFIPENQASYEDPHGHGTHCAGIICGMTPENVRILPLKVLNQNGYGDTLGIYCAMLYAAEQNADVISMSLGGDGCSPMIEEAVRVLKEKEIPCVVAAGNDHMDAKYYNPAGIPDVFTVSALSREMIDSDWIIYANTASGYVPSYFSNYGSRIDFAAPGDEIMSAGLENPDSTVAMSGTSMACPHAAGCVADVLTVHPDYTIGEVYDCLKGNARDLGTPGFDDYYGWGLVNISDLDFAQASLPQPEASAISGAYSGEFTVTLSTPEPDAEIRYTLDGSIPDTDTDILYDGEEILIDCTTVLSAVTVKNGERSCCVRWCYDFTQQPPYVVPASGTFDGSVWIEIEDSYNKTIYYTLDGTDPSPENGTLYTGPFEITETTLMKASVAIGRYVSEPCVRYYEIDGQRRADLMFETENGVLTHYYGFEDENSMYDVDLDLNDYFEPGEITRIGDGAFRFIDSEHHPEPKLHSIILPESVTSIGAYAFSCCKTLCSVSAPGVVSIEPYAFEDCHSLISVDMPALKTIGAYAFYRAFDYNCSAPPIDADNQIEVLGNGAFQTSDLKEAAFPHLKTLGRKVFACCSELETVILPANITVLPEMSFYACDKLAALDAPGVTELGDLALDHATLKDSALVNCTIDLSGLTSVGTRALKMFKTPVDCVSFDALTHIGYDAFGGFRANEIRLPALKEIPCRAFYHAVCQVVYLEQAEKLESGALTLNPALEKHIVFVFGDQVSKSLKNPLESGCDITVAAPAGSPMIQFAKAVKTDFRTTPDLYIPSGFDSCRQYDLIPLSSCIPLGFGCRIVWTALGTAYDAVYQAPEQPLYADESGEKLFLDTSVPGTVKLRADLVDASDTVLTSETVEMNIEPAEAGDIVTNEGVVLLDWMQGDIQIIPLEIQNIILGPSLYSVKNFTFKPEEEGEYYFIPENIGLSLSVYNSRNELIGFTKDCLYLGELRPEPVRLESGELYYIQAETRVANTLDNMYSGVLITQQMPTQMIEYNYELNLEQHFFEKGTGIPDISPLVSVTSPFYNWDTEEQPTLEQNVDYQIIYQQIGDSGTVLAFGIGDYFGMLHDSVYFWQDYKYGETVELPEIRLGQTLCYRIQNEDSEDPTMIGLRYTDTYLHDITIGENTSEPYDDNLDLSVMETEISGVSTENFSTYILREAVYKLHADQSYYILLHNSPYIENLQTPAIPAGKYALFTRKYDANHWLFNCNLEQQQEMNYAGDRINSIRSFTDPTGKKLERGKDYEVYTANDCIPGEEALIVVGIGDYYGTFSRLLNIAAGYSIDGPPATESLRLNEPFTVRKCCGMFELETDSRYSCRLRSTDADAYFKYTIYQYDEELLTWDQPYPRSIAKGEAALDLEAGSYLIYLAQDAENQEYILEAEETQICISKADVQADTLIFTGGELTPQITLTYDGNTLTEGEDYLLTYPEKPIIECGIYNMTVTGIGRFGDTRTVQVTVKAQESDALPQAVTGDNTLSVTIPGETAVCEWIAEDTNYGIRMDELLLASLVICDAETNAEVLRLRGNGYLFGFFDVTPGKTYRIYASWISPEQTGEIGFTLLSDYTDLSTCTAEGDKQILFTGETELPAFTVRDGETAMQKDTDYKICCSGGNNEPGHALISLTGTGAYIGRLDYHYYLCPELLSDTAAPVQTKELTLNADAAQYTLNPGDVQKFIFTAPADGCYRISRPAPQYSGVCVFAFAPDDTLLPLDCESVELKKDETIRFLAVSDHLEEYLRKFSEYRLAVYDDEPVYELRADDCVYQIRNGFAYLDQYEGENIGIQLPETVYDPENNTEIPVKGYTAKLLAETGISKTLYCDGAYETLVQMTEAGVCFAVTDPQTDVRGDITGDGIVNINDWLTLMRCITECPGMVLSNAAFAAADMNGDGILDLSDAEAVKQAV